MLAPWKNSYDKPRQYIIKQRHYPADKSPYSKSYIFSSSNVWMWELDHKEGWVLNNWCFCAVVLEKTLESPLDGKEIQPKGNQPWIFTEGLMLKFQYFKPAHWKRPWCWERLRAREEGGDRGWDGWIASLTQYTRIWANSGTQWRTGKSGVLSSSWGRREQDMT